jgi:Mg2+ and Co2+ transporter CorA
MKQQLNAKGITWTNVEQPTPEELAAAVRETQLLPLDAEFVAQEYQRPEVTVRPSYLLILTHVPVFDKQTRVTSGVALYLIIRETAVWTIHYEALGVIQKLWQSFVETPEKQEEYFGDRPLSLALYIINYLQSSSFRKLSRLTKHTDIVEDAVFQGNERKMVEEIAILTRDIMDFRKIIRAQRSLFADLPEHPFFDDESRTKWQRVYHQMQKLWEILESLLDSVKELGQTNNALLQYKQNELLRMLTFYSILSIPAFILVTPYNPSITGATWVDTIVYWAIFTILIVSLGAILFRAKRKGVL